MDENVKIAVKQKHGGVGYKLECNIPWESDIYVYMDVFENILKTLTFSDAVILKGFDNKTDELS